MGKLHEDDDVCNESSNETFQEVLERRLSRRSVIGGGLAVAATASAVGATGGGVATLLEARPAEAAGDRRRKRPLLGFTAIPTSTADQVVVPRGYTARVLIAWGDPVSNGPAFKPDASNTAAEQAQQWGMHNDGIVYFPFPFLGNHHGLIVQNHEYTDDVLLFRDGKANWNAEKTAKSQAAHGVGIIEVVNLFGRWRVRRPSRFARRITAATPIDIAGPAAGHDLLKTSADRTGKRVLGTLNNCAMGFTPWGTYLACEENFNGYFFNTSPNELETRYGVNTTSPTVPWHTTDTRFNTDLEPNEPNRFGWVTEINPWLPRSTPVKRTALGRVKHEGAWVEETDDGRVVVYMGDDQAGEYIYRYLSNQPWKRAFARGKHPLDDGVLYVAKFNADGTGDWLPLTPANPALAGKTQAEILINTRASADAVGATKMDRPEWIDVIDSKKEVYVTLTNNTGRTPATVDAVNPRANNVYGHIVRWGYEDDFSDPVFFWEIFALAGDPAVPAHGSTIMGDKFGSPDGIYVDPDERLWIQTDVSSSTINAGAYAGFGHNQMLAADPTTREIRRFLVGPAGCEITGCFSSPDGRALFVGIQHPGEAPSGDNDPANPKQFSSWPDGPSGGRPRSALVVITKDNGGVIGT
jgi:uncharacterized protein